MLSGSFLNQGYPRQRALEDPGTPVRSIVNALLYLAKAGCHWRLLPKSFPPL